MKYIQKYLNQRCDNALELPDSDIYAELVVVMPAYDEDIDSILEVVRSLAYQNNATVKYAVYILINTHEKDSSQLVSDSISLYEKLNDRLEEFNTDNCHFHLYYKHYTVKKSGVGHARKSLMDLAFRYFNTRSSQGIIVNIDADTSVADNYVNAIVDHFKSNPNSEAASIRYEHVIPDDGHPIIDYELHLRYFINMQRLIRLPYAYQTVGSAMAVRSHAYAKEGGMKKRQAGEDFYFLHKYTKNLTLTEINDTVVMPSSRKSGRVPFGTGKAVSDASKTDYSAMSYNYDSFIEIQKWMTQNLKVILDASSKSFKYQPSSCEALNDFLIAINAESDLNSIVLNTNNQEIRYKSFFAWFNAFQIMKCLHYMRGNGFPDQPIDICVKRLFSAIDLGYSGSRKENLLRIREYDMVGYYKEVDINDGQ